MGRVFMRGVIVLLTGVTLMTAFIDDADACCRRRCRRARSCGYAASNCGQCAPQNCNTWNDGTPPSPPTAPGNMNQAPPPAPAPAT
jgi:hypothetical protein